MKLIFLPWKRHNVYIIDPLPLLRHQFHSSSFLDYKHFWTLLRPHNSHKWHSKASKAKSLVTKPEGNGHHCHLSGVILWSQMTCSFLNSELITVFFPVSWRYHGSIDNADQRVPVYTCFQDGDVATWPSTSTLSKDSAPAEDFWVSTQNVQQGHIKGWNNFFCHIRQESPEYTYS